MNPLQKDVVMKVIKYAPAFTAESFNGWTKQIQESNVGLNIQLDEQLKLIVFWIYMNQRHSIPLFNMENGQ